MDNLITVIVASIPAVVAAYFSARFYTRQAKADFQKEFENKLNERKWQTYTEFAGIVRQVLEASKKPQNKRQSDEFATKLMGFAGSLWIVGSDEVIHAFNSWRQSQQGLNGGTPDSKEALVNQWC
jgi:H+/gluconate symporter-like permease